MISKIIELSAPWTITVKEEHLDSENLKDSEVVAETLYSALSPGTEIAAYTGAPPLRPSVTYPRVVGYCNVAEVIAVGNQVQKFKPGDKILTFQSHRSAFICQEDYIITSIPDGADLVEASKTYLFHLGYDALLKGDFKAGHNVAVIGLGTLGMATVALSAETGLKAFAFSNQSDKLKLAEELGAIRALRKNEKSINALIEEKTYGTGIDIVVNTSNSWEDWKLAISLPRKGGKVCVLGFPGRTDPIPKFNPLASHYFYDKQLSLIACGYTPDYDLEAYDLRFTIKRNCRFLLDMIINGKLSSKKIKASVEKWDNIKEIYEKFAQRKTTDLTCVLKWEKV